MDYVYKSKPYIHQHECFERSRDEEIFAILFEMGAGKSKVAVDTAAYLYSKGRINSVVILAPNGVHSKWLMEDIPLSLPDHIEYKAAIWQAGDKESMKQCENLLARGDHLRILCANIEGMSYEALPKFLKRFLLSLDALVVVDESTRIKSPTSLRTKKLMKLQPLMKYRRILAGDAVVNEPFDLFSQFGFLDHDILGHSFPAFKNEYAEIIPKDHPMIQHIVKARNLRFAPQIIEKNIDGSPKYRNLERLKEKIAPYSMTIKKADCLDLPPKIYEKRFHKLAPTQHRIYSELAENARFEFMDTTVSILHKLTTALRLQQVVDGFRVDDKGKLFPLFAEPKDNPRIALLLDTLEDIPGQVIIWCRFQTEIEMISRLLGDSCVTYYGPLSKGERADNLADFKSGKKQYLVGTAQSGGIGLNLANSSTVIYYSNSFNAGHRWQSEDRVHRIGQEADKVLYIDLIAENTIDEKILSTLRAKKDLSDYLLDLRNFS